MRLLCDANIGKIIATELSAHGHDVVRAVHIAPDAPDDVILALAVVEERVLITCDHHFGGLIFFRGHVAPIAVIYIRFEPEDVREIMPRLLPLLENDTLSAHMTVIDEVHTRRRPFPTVSNDNG